MCIRDRFCPIWHFPSVPLSEAILLCLKSGRYHVKYLLDLQFVEEAKRPISRSEMLYQIHENDIAGICPLEDSSGARAMEEMLHENGWTWSDVVDLMTSPLSPRDSEGWLIQQQTLGIDMPFAKLTGFVVNTSADRPSIEIVAVPADPSCGLVGLFSMDDVQTVLQLAAADAYPIHFSLDPPNLHQKYHPFYKCRYAPKELQNSLFLHTLFEADYLLKFFSGGVEVSAKPPFESRLCSEGLTKNLPPEIVEAIKPLSERGSSSPHGHRFWIQVDTVESSIKETAQKVEFKLGDPKISIRSHPHVPGPDLYNKEQDTEFEDDPESPEAKFVSDFTSHYHEISKHFPMFARLRELAKLQTLVPIILTTKGFLKRKADGVGLEVPTFLLTEIQQDAYQQNQDKLDNILKTIDEDVGVWPAAENPARVASTVKTIMDSKHQHRLRGATISNIEPHAKTILQEKDQEVLDNITEYFFELCGQKLSRDELKRSVLQWLMYRNSTSATELKDLVLSLIHI